MKICFLDIDGVISSHCYINLKNADENNIVDESRLPLLKRFVDKTGAKIVLSSSWRKHWHKDESLCDSIGKEINAIFAKHELSIFDKTPQLPSNDRAKEIKMWLHAHDVEGFVIFDDIAFGWGSLDDRVVKTSWRIGRGLEKRHIEKAIKLLNE